MQQKSGLQIIWNITVVWDLNKWLSPGELKLIFSSGRTTLLVPVEQTNTSSSLYRKAVEPEDQGNKKRVACRTSSLWRVDREQKHIKPFRLKRVSALFMGEELTKCKYLSFQHTEQVLQKVLLLYLFKV